PAISNTLLGLPCVVPLLGQHSCPEECFCPGGLYPFYRVSLPTNCYTEPFIFEAPYKRHVFGNVALAVIARLIAEQSLDDHFAGWAHQRLQNRLLSKSDLAADSNVTAIHRKGLADRFRAQHLRVR